MARLPQDASAHEYAEAVVDGRQVAGRHIVAACERHLRDIEQGHYGWDTRPLAAFETWCQDIHIMDTSADARGLIPFRLQPWQRFFVGNLLCSTIASNDDHLSRVKGTRRFRQGILFTGKGAGKSTLVAFLAGWLLMDDGYYQGDQFIQAKGFRGYLMGETRGQVVETCFSVLTDALMEAGFAAGGHTDLDLAILGGKAPHTLVCTSNSGSIEALATSGTGRGTSGLRPHLVVAEEVGAWSNSTQLDKLTNGFKNALQPLLLVMSNPGRQRTGVGWKFRELARKSSESHSSTGELDHVFGLLFENDREDFGQGKRWWPVHSNWVKSNPTLGTTIRDDYLRAKIHEATDRPFERDSVKQLQFGAWADEGGPLFTAEAWIQAQVDRVEPPVASDCYIGIDLSTSRDMTGVAYVWQQGDQVVARVRHYVQGSTVRDREVATSQPFTRWVRDGHLIVAGEQDIELAHMSQEIAEVTRRHPQVHLASDQYQRARLCDALGCVPEKQALGGSTILHMHPHGYSAPQGSAGLSMHGSIEELIRLVDAGRLQLEANPVTDWNLNCAKVPARADGKLNIVNSFPRERRGPSRGQIDGLMALIMAVGLWAAQPQVKPNPLAAYSDPDYRFYGQM